MGLGKVVFIGAGPGDPELITVKAMNYIKAADTILYAGSLVNTEVISRWARPDAEVINTANLVLEDIAKIMIDRARSGKLVVRLKSGDPSIYGALLEEMWALEDAGIPFEVVPGITAALAAAAVLNIELTLPKLVQTVIITRESARVPMEGSIRDYAPFVMRGAVLVIYTAVHLIDKVVKEFREAGVPSDTPVVVVYRTTWPDQKVVRGTLADIAEKVKRERILKDSVIIIGKSVEPYRYKDLIRSSVYDPSHTHSFRPYKVSYVES
ncbi:precorrin-4 C(11)-methyltransferase [Vulcanisaeta sp. JCM 16161]|uniref:precorrin-4 C(11)-methyltransferase n=1 Tax=Vulcanisaeta sp. JCM 16161 TaxID=1295372 RepID=UPI00406CB581